MELAEVEAEWEEVEVVEQEAVEWERVPLTGTQEVGGP